ncbi:MAG: helix-turn-helix domain-containing protein [Deltaproteobacteria bacterium]|nr:helix-turn-helix domain-containing protein [Deltaproteobacteria bacterium]
MAKISSRKLSAFAGKSEDREIQILPQGPQKETITLPAPVFRMLMDILTQMSMGNAVAIIPHHAELTTQQAADFLQVSRPYLVGVLDKKEIPFRKVGTHRRVLFQDLVEYQTKKSDSRKKALDELTQMSQQLGMEY